MKAICKQKKVENTNYKDSVGRLYSEFKYDELILEKEYVVLGLAIYKSSPCLHYLIDEDGWPDWYPYPLFTVSDPRITEQWYIEILGKDSPGDIQYLYGFYELCCDDDFYDALVDREEWAMDIYFKRKHEAQRDIF